MQLIVLGMHRSGTSVLARILNLMGAYFGPEGMSTGALPENPKGFWERRDVRALNDAVLHSIGCDWNRVHGFDASQVPEHVLARFDEYVSRIVLEMDSHRPWFIKEPRLCLLFPLWRRRLEVPFCIHILRHPVEVASSLCKRNGMPMSVGLALWEIYVRSSLAASSDLPGIMVSHAALMSDPVATAAHIHEQLVENGISGIRVPGRREIESFVDPGLHRENKERADLRRYAEAPQVALFESLLSGSESWPARAEVSEELRNRLETYEAGLPPLAATGELVLPEKQIAAIQQHAEVVELNAALQAAQNLARERAGEVHKLTRMALAAEERFQGDLRRAGRREADLESALSTARQETERLVADLGQAHEEIALQQGQFEELETAFASSQGSAKRHARSAEAARQKARSLEIRLLQLRGQLRSRHELFNDLTASPSWTLTAPLRWVQRRLGGDDAAVAALEARVETIRDSGLFDEDWYMDRYPQVAASGLEPIVHYLRLGAGEGRDPSSGFITLEYVAAHPELTETGENPLLHFIEHRRLLEQAPPAAGGTTAGDGRGS